MRYHVVVGGVQTTPLYVPQDQGSRLPPQSRDRVSDLIPDFASVLGPDPPVNPLSAEEQHRAWLKTMSSMFPA